MFFIDFYVLSTAKAFKAKQLTKKNWLGSFWLELGFTLITVIPNPVEF